MMKAWLMLRVESNTKICAALTCDNYKISPAVEYMSNKLKNLEKEQNKKDSENEL